MFKKIIFLLILLLPTISSAEDAIKSSVDHYISKFSQQLYKADSKKLSLMKMSHQTTNWKIKKGDYRVPHLTSASFLMRYKPKVWEIEEVKQAGHFAKVYVKISIGDPLQLKLSKSNERQAIYSLIKDQENWYIVDFLDPLANQKQKEAKEYREALKKGKEKVAVEAADLGPQEIISRYFTEVVKEFGKDGGQAPATKIQTIVNNTDPLWIKNRSTNRLRAQNATQLAMLHPFTWNIVSSEQTIIRVEITPKPGKNKLLIKSLPKKFHFSLIQKNNTWLIEKVDAQK